jgi:hypothetical protein
MKKVALLLPLALVASVAMAQTQTQPAPKATDAPKADAAKAADKAPAAVKTHDVNAEFVSADAVKKTVTLKAEDGSEKTVPLEGKALAAVKTLKANDKVTATCRDNDKGEHQAVTDIKPAAAPKK